MKLKKTAAELIIFCIYFALSAVWSSHFFSLLNPSANIIMDGDAGLNAWTLNWVSHALSHNWTNLFDGNAFYPHTNSIALSEHMFGLAVLIIPIRWFTSNPWVGYNALIFAAYFLSAIGAYLFIMNLTNNRLAAFWGGIFWAFGFFRIHHIGHLQILSYQWFPYVGLYLLKIKNSPSLKNTILFSSFFVLQALVSWYLAVITSILVIIIA